MTALSLRERFSWSRFFQGEKATDGPLTLDRRRIFILPNRRGLSLALLLFLQILTATHYNNNLAFLLSFLLVGIALLGILYGYRNLAGVVVRTGRAEPVFAGDRALFELHLDNPSRTPRWGIEVRLRHGATQSLNLPPEDSVTVRLGLIAERRGWLELPTVTLFTLFPLGLFRVWSPINLNQRVMVYPKPADTPMPFPDEPGQAERNTATDDFHGFQNYQPGDPLRRIHWKGVAKGQGVHIKTYRNGEQEDLVLDWARTPGVDTETRLSRLCRWVIDAENTGLRYALRLPGLTLAAAGGAEHRRRCLEALALFGIPP